MVIEILQTNLVVDSEITLLPSPRPRVLKIAFRWPESNLHTSILPSIITFHVRPCEQAIHLCLIPPTRPTFVRF
jgi:hypothetical protein